LHTDTTSLKVYSAYERVEAEGPLVTFGYSRDHRPDLKQLLFELTVTVEGVPVWGHVTDGNRSDTIEHRFHITQLRQYLPDLGEPLVVADSKFFAGETMALATAHQFRFVTLVPQTVGLRQELVDSPELRAAPAVGTARPAYRADRALSWGLGGASLSLAGGNRGGARTGLARSGRGIYPTGQGQSPAPDGCAADRVGHAGDPPTAVAATGLGL
jgi:hypothetical protein